MRLVILALVFASTLPAIAADEPVRLTQTIPLPDVNGRFDHFALDVNGQRLFVAALGNDTVEILNIAEGKRLRTISGLHKPQGVAFLPDRNLIVAASGGDGSVKLINGSSYVVEQTLSSLDDADNVRVDSAEGRVYIGYGSGALAIINAATGEHMANIKLEGHPESFQLEKKGSRIFVNVPDAGQVVVVDRKSRRVVTTWSLKDFRANYPMALDEENHRLFVGCRRPSRLGIFDTETGHQVSDLAISDDTDDLFYDAARRRIYVAGGGGAVDLIEQKDADHYVLHAKVPTASGARTAFFAAESSTLFVAIPKRGAQGAEIRAYQIKQ